MIRKMRCGTASYSGIPNTKDGDRFLADRTIGRAFGTMCRLSDCSEMSKYRTGKPVLGRLV